MRVSASGAGMSPTYARIALVTIACCADDSEPTFSPSWAGNFPSSCGPTSTSSNVLLSCAFARCDALSARTAPNSALTSSSIGAYRLPDTLNGVVGSTPAKYGVFETADPLKVRWIARWWPPNCTVHFLDVDGVP